MNREEFTNKMYGGGTDFPVMNWSAGIGHVLEPYRPLMEAGQGYDDAKEAKAVTDELEVWMHWVAASTYFFVLGPDHQLSDYDLPEFSLENLHTVYIPLFEYLMSDAHSKDWKVRLFVKTFNEINSG